MSHDITIRSDRTAEAAFALKPAWHGLGTVLDHPMTSAEALTAAQLDWQVVQREVGAATPRMIETPEGPVEGQGWLPIPQHRANFRDDNNEFLGMVGTAYQVVQNTEAFEFLDELIAGHAMEYESAFSLNSGRRVCMLGRLPEVDRIVEGDETLRYVMLSLTHDGTGAIQFGPTSVRVVCANTHALAVKRGTTRELTVRHTGKMADKLSQARRILQGVTASFDEHAQTCKGLARATMTDAEWTAYLDVMCPRLSELDPDWTPRRARAISETRQAIEDCYRNARQTLDGVKGTAWAAYNAVSEHIDHLPRRGATRDQKAEARFNVCLYGAGRDQKERAFQAACKFAGMAS